MRMYVAMLLLLLAGIGFAAPSAPPASTVKGEVLEVKDVDAYTYLRLKTQDGEVWAAVGKAPVTRGSQVTIENAMVMTHFTSRTLGKTFDRIIFGSLAGSGGAPGGGSVAAMHAPAPQPAAVGDVKVPKATGANARTVAEIVTARADLTGKTVLVRGKVVKYTPGVLGKNWVHIRDGTGSAGDKSNDVVVTTQDETAIGNVVLVTGVVRTNVDVGAGYAYPVLIDEAKLQK
jgi:hypothetical protein